MPEICQRCNREAISCGSFCENCGARLPSAGGPDNNPIWVRVLKAFGFGVLALVLGGFGLCSLAVGNDREFGGPMLVPIGLVALGLAIASLFGLARALVGRPKAQ